MKSFIRWFVGLFLFCSGSFAFAGNPLFIVENHTTSDVEVHFVFSVYESSAHEGNYGGMYDLDETHLVAAGGATAFGSDYPWGTPFCHAEFSTVGATVALSGNSYVSTGAPGTVVLYEATDANFSSLDTQIVSIDPGALRPVNPDSSKTSWVVDGSTLSAEVYREGVDKLAWEMQQLKAQAAQSMPTPFVAHTFSLTGVDEASASLSTAVGSVDSKFTALIASPPVLTTGSAPASGVLSVTFPSLTVGSITTTAHVFNIDPTDYAGPITAMRTFILGLLYIAFFFSILELLKSAVTEAKTFYWLSNASDR